MKMYGNSGNMGNGRKYVKSVERKIPLDSSGGATLNNLSAGKHRNLLKLQN